MKFKSSNSIFVYLGANANRELVHQLLDLDSGIRFIESALYPEQQQSLFEDKLSNESVITFDSKLVLLPGIIGFTPVNEYNKVKIIESVMDDKLLPLLWTRFNGKMRWQNLSEVKRYEVAYSLIKSSIETCFTHKPSIVVFSYEPHMLPMYIFKKVCEAIGIKTCTMIISPFNWKVFLDVKNNRNLEFNRTLLGKINDEVSKDSVYRFINEKKSDYSVAKPFYEKRNLGNSFGNKLIYKLKEYGRQTHNLILGQIAFTNYKRLSIKRSGLKNVNYVCVFLQLQPEQTTLPDGGLFVHHLFVIQMLYSAVSPLGLSLVIREHPATFAFVKNTKWRPRDFYSSIKNIGPNIYLDDINADPYSLIKNSSAVSAITGTVLLEGLLLGRPVVAFGKHPLKEYTSTAFVDKFADEVELRDKVAKAIEESPQSIISDFENYLHMIYPTTFGPCEYIGNAKMSLEKLRESRYNALRQVIELITKEYNSKTRSLDFSPANKKTKCDQDID
jgi:hypothetical protein